jgi:hypothetical protein
MPESNPFLDQSFVAALIAGFAAQILKVLIDYLKNKSWNPALFLRAGGMPSSHSAMVAALTQALGLYHGFGSPLFAISATLAVIVIYDATGIRRQAGKHAAVINQMIRELASGHPLQQERLGEVLGHTPLEAIAGTILGIVVAQIIWFIWR